MNLRGDVVGPSRSAPDGQDHGLVWHHDGTVTDLGPHTSVQAINRRGDVAGSFSPDPTSVHAAVWRDGVRIDLAPDGSIASFAEAINDSGQVLVNSLDSAGSWRPHLWDDGVLTPLPIRGGRRGAVGVGLNPQGLTVVHEAVSGESAAGWSLRDGSSRLPEYRDPDGNLTTVPAGLKDRGDVFGHDFVWREGTYTEIELPSRQGVCCSWGAFAMNRRGQLVGASPVDESTRHATLWDDGEVVDLGTLAAHRGSVAYDINAWGDVVGAAEDPVTATRAVRWTVRGR